MSDNDYRGDHPTKKVARDIFWTRAMETTPEPFCYPNLNSLFMVLASRECGDISWLVGMGVPVECIVAVDRDPDAIAAVTQRFPRVQTFIGDVGEAAYHYRGRVAVSFLDFCGNLSFRLIETCRRVATRAFRGRDRGMLGIGFMRGRERVDGKSLIRQAVAYKASSEVQDYADQIRRLRPVEEGPYPDSIGRMPFETDRAAALRIELSSHHRTIGRHLFQYGNVAYQGPYTPMQYMLFDSVLESHIEEYSQTHSHPTIDPNRLVFGDGESISLRENSVRNLVTGSTTDLGKLNIAINQGLGLLAVVGKSRAAARMNVSESTITAWQAHSTRGTYGGGDGVYHIPWQLQDWFVERVDWFHSRCFLPEEAMAKNLMHRTGGLTFEQMQELIRMVDAAVAGRSDPMKKNWQLTAENLRRCSEARIRHLQKEPTSEDP